MMNQSVTIFTIIHLFKRNLGWIIGSTAIGFLSFLLYSMFFITPLYTSSIDINVYNSQKVDAQTGSAGNQMSLSDINLATRLVDTYIVMLNNRAIISQVSEGIGKKMSTGEISKSLSMQSVNNTEVLRITCSTPDKNLSAEICNKIADIAPDFLKEKAKVGGVEIISPAIPSSSSSYPNIKTNAIMGAMLGFIISAGLVFILYQLDNTVKGEEDLKAHVDIAVLGEIPTIEPVSIGGGEGV